MHEERSPHSDVSIMALCAQEEERVGEKKEGEKQATRKLHTVVHCGMKVEKVRNS